MISGQDWSDSATWWGLALAMIPFFWGMYVLIFR